MKERKQTTEKGIEDDGRGIVIKHLVQRNALNWELRIWIEMGFAGRVTKGGVEVY